MSLIEQYLESENEKRVIFLAVFIAVSASLAVIEKFIPSPIPWIKPGFANIIPLILIILKRYKDAFIVGILRTFLTSIMIGGLFSIGHIFSLFGAFFSILFMVLISHFFRRFFSVVGVSVFGAFIHSISQLFIGIVLFFSFASIRLIAPVFLIISIISGVLTGFVALRIILLCRYKYE